MRRRLGAALVQTGTISEAQLQAALAEHERTHERLGRVLVRMNLASDEAVSRQLAAQLGFPYVELAELRPDPLAIESIPRSLAAECGCIGVSRLGNVLTIAMFDPLRFSVVARVEDASGCQVKQVVASRMDILDAIGRAYPVTASAEHSADADGSPGTNAQQLASPSIGVSVEDTSAGLVELVVGAAIERQASEIQIESIENGVVVRHRTGSGLTETLRLPRGTGEALADRLKLMAGLQIEERRLPQTGRVRLPLDAVQVDLRLSTIRILAGERLVLRLARPRMRPPALEDLGLSMAALMRLRGLLERRRGVIIVVGPPGSGRSTTLSSMAAALAASNRRAVTVESQSSAALVAALKENPDAVVVGDVEDEQVAAFVVDAARRGPLFLGALQADDVASAVSRLGGLGVEPRVMSGVLIGVVAQHLVRRLCDRCRQPSVPPAAVTEALKVTAGDQQREYHRPIGCDACDYTGFRGRIGLFEVVEVSHELRRLIADQGSEDEIRVVVRATGTAGIVDEGLAAVEGGRTTADELLRHVRMRSVPRPLCGGCGLAVESDYVACPQCGQRQHPPCSHCGRALQPGWRVCPYCERPAVRWSRQGDEARSGNVC